MRRLLIALAAVAIAALGIVPALADGPVKGSLCGDITVVVNGEALIDESDCLPGDAPALPGLPEAPGAPELPGLPV